MNVTEIAGMCEKGVGYFNFERVYIYLIYDIFFRRYKVGMTKNIKRRHYELEHGAGTELKIESFFLGFKINEKKLHKYLRPYKLKGEWYVYCHEVLEIFEECEYAVLTGDY